jgi:2-polyprenyl-6-methoxyphenol hydroxylase-like FAD-dependent oxidoreductase
VVLVGDAAHATSPNMAEGASMGLEDALVLTYMLTTHGSADETLLSFNARRLARLRWLRHPLPSRTDDVSPRGTEP